MARLRDVVPSRIVRLAVCRGDGVGAETWKRSDCCPGRVVMDGGTRRFGPPEIVNSPGSSSADSERVQVVLVPAAKVGGLQLSIRGWEIARISESAVL